MSSGTLPLAAYHRAQSLGEGTFGSVVAVFNDDGEEYALKLFLEDEDEEEEQNGMDLGALREISILRLLRHDNGHPNIIPLVDVKTAETDEEEEYGAGTTGCMAMAMPLYKHGNLGDAVDKGALTNASKKVKVDISHGLLSAVAFLHDNGIMHRDIKADNVMLELTSENTWRPVLIDFSLAKLVNATMYGSDESSLFSKETELTHTGEVGTVTYVAPEVLAHEPYGVASDLYSVGVVLLEMLRNHTLEAAKNNQAVKMIQDAKESLPDQPFANMIRGLLTVDPGERLTARGALASPVFEKFSLPVPPVRVVDIHKALPFDDEAEDSDENDRPNATTAANKKKKDPVLVKRQKLIQKVCNELECSHPMTPYAAMVYCQQMLQLDDTLDDMSSSQTLLDSVILASKFFETELLNLDELQERETGLFKNWTKDEYIDNESTIWLMLDHCLYPRGMKEWQE